MPQKKSLFSLLILTTLTACQPAAKSVVKQIPQQAAIPALSKENVGDFENYSVLSTQDEWKIITWSGKAVSQPGNKIRGGISSTVSILKKEKQAWRVVSQKQFADSYNPRLQLHTEFTLAGKPVFILKLQQGAAYEELQVYGLAQGEYKLLQGLVAGAFEWTYDAAGNKKSLLAVSATPGEQAATYQWNGQQFMLISAAETSTKSADYVTD
ncbi:hypothetical protein ACO0LL_16000 [Undibacterium sp. TC4M20W]|uniref:hypothetical protein n=1 Tax=Undibacterium sp. TC4M20W TaxID=3413052 RepID=UPI003BF2E0E5